MEMNLKVGSNNLNYSGVRMVSELTIGAILKVSNSEKHAPDLPEQ